MKRLTVMLMIIMLSLFATSGFGAYRPAAVGDLFHKGDSGEDVRSYGAVGDGVTDDEPAFALAIAAAAGGRVIVTEATTSYKLSSHVTIPAGVTVEFRQGGLLSIDTSIVFTVNGTIEAGLYQIFSGAGTAVLAAGSCEQVIPQWFGAVGDDSTDNATALNAAMVAAQNVGTMFIPAGTYQLSTPINTWEYASIALHEGGPDIVGAGMEDTVLKYTSATGFAISVDNPDDTSANAPSYVTIRDLQITCPSLVDASGDSGGVLIAASQFITLERVAFHDFNDDGAYVTVRSRWIEDTESSMTHDTDNDFTTTGAGATEKYALKFTSRANYATFVRSVTLQLKRTGSPAGTIKAAIYTDSSGPDTKTGTYSATVTNTALSAAADGSAVEFVFDSLDEDALPTLVAATDYWVVLETEGYTYADGVTEVILRSDAGGGAAGSFGIFDFGGSSWSTSNDGSNNELDFSFGMSILAKIISCQAHASAGNKADYGLRMEHWSQAAMIGSSFYVDGVAGAYSYGPENILYVSGNSQLSSSATTPPIEAHGGETNVTQSYIEGGSSTAGQRLLFDQGYQHTLTDTHVAAYLDWTDGTRVNFDMPLNHPYSDDGQYVPREFLYRIYDVANSTDVELVGDAAAAADGDALNDSALQTSTQNNGFFLKWVAANNDFLPRGSYLITVVAKDTNQVADDLVLQTAWFSAGGAPTTMASNTFTMTAGFKSYQIVHVLTEAEMQLGGSRLLVFKATAGANTVSISHVIVEYMGPDIILEKNLVAFSSDQADGDGDRASEVTFIGQQSGAEQSALAAIKASHDGASDDEKGKLEIFVNDGDDGFSPTLAVGIDSDGDVALGLATGSMETTSQYQIELDGTKNILVDGRTNPRNMTLGVMRYEHTPSIDDTRVIHIDIDANSHPDTHGIFARLLATGIATGESIMAYEATLDKADSTGGCVDNERINTGGAGSAVAHASHVGADVVVIHQESGTFGNVEQAWDENGGFTDVTAAFNSTVTDVTIFSANADMVHVGDAADFDSLQVNLDTFASGAGVRPTFEYSIAGPGWTTFVPNDGTNGFRASGTISWDSTAFVAWAAVNVNGATKKYIRITRTQVGLGTSPIEDTIQVLASNIYEWDENGDVSINDLTAAGVVLDSAGRKISHTEIIPEGDGGDNDTVEYDKADTTNRMTYLRVTGVQDGQDNNLYCTILVKGTPATLTFYTRVSDRGNLAAFTLDVEDRDGNADATGQLDVEPSADATWELMTYTFTGTYTKNEWLWLTFIVDGIDTADTAEISDIAITY